MPPLPACPPPPCPPACSGRRGGDPGGCAHRHPAVLRAAEEQDHAGAGGAGAAPAQEEPGQVHPQRRRRAVHRAASCGGAARGEGRPGSRHVAGLLCGVPLLPTYLPETAHRLPTCPGVYCLLYRGFPPALPPLLPPLVAAPLSRSMQPSGGGWMWRARWWWRGCGLGR